MTLLSATVFALAGGADAHAKTLKYVSQAKTVPTATLPGLNGRTEQEVACPASHPRVLGGGVMITGDNSDFDLEVAETRPDVNGKAPDGWIGQANNSSGSDAQMTSTAICMKGLKGRLKNPTSAAAVIAPGGQATAQAFCPPHTKVTGGGTTTSSSSFKVEVATSRPIDGPDRDSIPDDGWLGSANNGGTSGEILSVDAICVSANSGRYKYIQSAPATVPNNSAFSVQAGCPAKTSVVGGGIANSAANIGAEMESSFPSPDQGWVGSANNDNIGTSETVQTFAICRK